MMQNGLAVRAPRPLGEGTAWRTVHVDGTLAHRVFRDGIVLAVVAKSKDSPRFDRFVDTPTNGTNLVARDIEVRGGIAGLDLRDDGAIEVHRHSLTGVAETLVLGHDAP